VSGNFLDQLEAHRGNLVAYCRGVLWEPRDLEDAVQEVIVQALRAYGRFIPGTDFKRWLFKVASLTLKNLNRKRRPLPLGETMDARSAPPELVWEEDYDAILDNPERLQQLVGDRLHRSLDRLTVSERMVFLLRAVADLRYRDIAGALDMPIGSVMGHLARARMKLRRALAECAHEM
jgi:RNA polymerase sigma-70 factor (ECF subfamily)